MTIEKLVPNGDDSGWGTGSYLDIDEGIAGADAAVMSTDVDDDVLIIDLSADTAGIVDGDTVNSVAVDIRAKDGGGGGTNSLVVDLLIGGVGQGTTQVSLTSTFGTLAFTNANWDADWTAAQIDGMQLSIKANQTGKGTPTVWSIDAIDVDIDWTLSDIDVTISATEVALTMATNASDVNYDRIVDATEVALTMTANASTVTNVSNTIWLDPADNNRILLDPLDTNRIALSAPPASGLGIPIAAYHHYQHNLSS